MDGENEIMRSIIVCTLHQILIKVIKPRRMTWPGYVAIKWMMMRNAYKFSSDNVKERDHDRKVGIYVKIILKRNLTEIGCEDVNCIHLAEDRIQWRVVMNTAVNLRIP